MTVIVKRYNFSRMPYKEKDQLIRQMFEEEGYTVVDTGYLQSTKKVKLISPEGNEWEVAPTTFKQGVRCPLDSNKSWGERCIASVLKQNNIDFKTQYTIFHDDDTRQYMDFYVEYCGGRYDIEYNGRQHYKEERINRMFSSLEEQKERDKKKRDYCKDNNITYVEIPYTVSEIKEIAKELKKYIPVIDLNKDYVVETFNYDKEIAEYYMNHSEVETANKFNVSGAKVRKTAYKLGYRKKGNYNEEDIIDYYKNNSATKTAEKFGVTTHVVYGLARKYKINKSKGYTDQEVIAYYMNHTLKQTQKRFNIGVTTITSIMRRNGIRKQKGGKNHYYDSSQVSNISV